MSDSETRPTIFLTAAEASGDTHAANLIKALKAKCPDARFVGVGGPRMAAAGCELLEDVTARAGMLLDPLKQIPYYRRLIRQTTEAMASHKADIHVPVDSPGLNWHMAKGARKCGIPVMYYVAPQVWAWAPWRIRKVRRLTDHVACILPFEQEYFRSRGVAATFVGHPLFDHVTQEPKPYPELPADGAFRIALAPGSRPGEIRRHAAALAEAAGLIGQRFDKADYTFVAADERAAAQIAEAAGDAIPIETGRTLEVIADSHLTLAASGTLTLEAASLGAPMLIFYRVSRLAKAMLGWLMRIKYFSLVNILADRELVPELMPWHGNVRQLADAAIEQLSHPDRLPQVSAELVDLTRPLICPHGCTASEAVADLVLQTMREKG